MGRKYMRVVVRNDSNATLRLKQHWTSRDWTGGWSPTQHAQAQPGAAAWWQAEGDSVFGEVATSGVEARTWYDVLDGAGATIGELYIFANCPVVESQYGNTFHVRAPNGFYAAYADAKGQKVLTPTEN